MTIQELGEFSFIDTIMEGTLVNTATVRRAIGDDSAVYLASEEMDQLVTIDTMVEGIHFDLAWMDGESIGFRLMTANISDIAAMGGIPKQAVISVAVPRTMEVSTLEAIYRGLKACASSFGTNIIGGDTVATTSSLVLTVTVIGEVPKGTAVLRSGACVGDRVGVTGTLGLSTVGLRALKAQAEGFEKAKNVFLRPIPNVTLGTILRTVGATSLNDISDGLGREALEIATASQVGLELVEKEIPLHEEVKKWGVVEGVSPEQYAFTGGEDFELLFTMPEAQCNVLEEVLKQENRVGDITWIGRVVEGNGDVCCLLEDGKRKLSAKGYEHFSL